MSASSPASRRSHDEYELQEIRTTRPMPKSSEEQVNVQVNEQASVQVNDQNNQPLPEVHEPEVERPLFNESFVVETPKFKDAWAGILFLLTVLGMIAVSTLEIQNFAGLGGFNGKGYLFLSNHEPGFGNHTLILFAFCLCLATVLGFGFVLLARACPKGFIQITLSLNAVLGIAIGTCMLATKYWSGGSVFILFSLFAVLCYFAWSYRISSSSTILQISVEVSKTYGRTCTVGLIGGICAVIFGAWYYLTLVAVIGRYQRGILNEYEVAIGWYTRGKLIGPIVFITFAAYWITEWLKNTIYATVSATYAAWFFHPQNFPRKATGSALKRCLTYGFGSICLGSLGIAPLNLIRYICSLAGQETREERTVAEDAASGALQCIVYLLNILYYIGNRYGLWSVALHGQAYLPASRRTWHAMNRRGVYVIMNELLIGPALAMGAIFVGCVCALFAYLYLVLTAPVYNSDGQCTPVIVAFAFLMGFQVTNVFTMPLSSGAETILFATACHPRVMTRDHPLLYARLILRHPRLQMAVDI